MYEIIQFNFKKPNEHVKYVDTLEEAQEWCQREDTHGDGWFHGYEEIRQREPDGYRYLGDGKYGATNR